MTVTDDQVDAAHQMIARDPLLAAWVDRVVAAAVAYRCASQACAADRTSPRPGYTPRGWTPLNEQRGATFAALMDTIFRGVPL